MNLQSRLLLVPAAAALLVVSLAPRASAQTARERYEILAGPPGVRARPHRLDGARRAGGRAGRRGQAGEQRHRRLRRAAAALPEHWLRRQRAVERRGDRGRAVRPIRPRRRQRDCRSLRGAARRRVSLELAREAGASSRRRGRSGGSAVRCRRCIAGQGSRIAGEAQRTDCGGQSTAGRRSSPASSAPSCPKASASRSRSIARLRIARSGWPGPSACFSISRTCRPRKSCAMLCCGIRRTRCARFASGGIRTATVRVVLDLEGVKKYSVFTLYNPFRLIVDCEPVAPTSAAAAAKVRGAGGRDCRGRTASHRRPRSGDSAAGAFARASGATRRQ